MSRLTARAERAVSAVSMASPLTAMQLQLAASPCFVGADGTRTALAARDAALLGWRWRG